MNEIKLDALKSEKPQWKRLLLPSMQPSGFRWGRWDVDKVDGDGDGDLDAD